MNTETARAIARRLGCPVVWFMYQSYRDFGDYEYRDEVVTIGQYRRYEEIYGCVKIATVYP